MRFLKVEEDGRTEYLNLDKVINIAPLANGKVKILMGAGMAWHVSPESIELVDCYNDLYKAIMEAYQ